MKNIQMIDLNQYIDLTTMIVLATIDTEGNPYTSNMYFKVDGNYNFYFKSKSFREHSQHIVKNQKVAWSILNSEKYQKSDKDKKGLQFQWTAKQLMWKEAEQASKDVYGIEMSFFEMMQKGQFIYQCIPHTVKIWDESLYGGQGEKINF